MNNVQINVIREMWELAKEQLCYSHPDINIINQEIDALKDKIINAFPDDWVKII